MVPAATFTDAPAMSVVAPPPLRAGAVAVRAPAAAGGGSKSVARSSVVCPGRRWRMLLMADTQTSQTHRHTDTHEREIRDDEAERKTKRNNRQTDSETHSRRRVEWRL